MDLSPGLKFWALLPAFLLITIITSFKAVADISAVQRVSRRQSRASDFRLIQGGLNINGLSNLVSGLSGTMPTMTASPSVAMISLTGVASRAVGIWAGIIFIFLALLPKLTAVLLAIPAPVAAAYIMIITGLVFIEGVETVAKDGIDHRKAVVVAVSFWVGMGFQNQAIFADLLTGTWNALLSNSLTSGGLAAALMIGFIELTAARRKRLEVDLDFTSMPEVDRFLQRFAIDRGWNEASTERLRAAGEETLAIMALYEAEDVSGKERRLIVNALVNDDIAELEFLSAAYDVENLEDRLAYMSEQPEVLDELEVSYRLLRHYSSSVRHQKFHNKDVITVHVEGSRSAFFTVLDFCRVSRHRIHPRQKQSAVGPACKHTQDRPLTTVCRKLIAKAYSIREPPHARETPAAVGSTMTFTTAGFPLANARSSAGRISSGSVTFSPYAPSSRAMPS